MRPTCDSETIRAAAAGLVDVDAQAVHLGERGELRGLAVDLARGVGAVEEPERLEEQAAQRRQARFLVLHRIGAAAADEAHVRLLLAQQLQVVERSVGGLEDDLNPVGLQCRRIALAEFRIGTAGRAGREGDLLGRLRLEPPVRRNEQADDEKDDGSGGGDEIADREKKESDGLGHGHGIFCGFGAAFVTKRSDVAHTA